MKYFIVDVFCREKYAGNQLAVVIKDKPLPDTLMQNIASEFHFSETTFVNPKQNNDGSWNVRIFTPKNEVPFAGHPTLGTSWVIRNEIVKHKYFGSHKTDITVEQGYEIDRKSILHLKANLENDLYNIEVGGSVIKTAQGELCL